MGGGGAAALDLHTAYVLFNSRHYTRSIRNNSYLMVRGCSVFTWCEGEIGGQRKYWVAGGKQSKLELGRQEVVAGKGCLFHLPARTG